jgi:hypothetical protein
MTQTSWYALLPAAQEKRALSVPNLTGHSLKVFVAAWIELMDIKGPSIWKALALGKVEALKEPKQLWDHTVDPAVV